MIKRILRKFIHFFKDEFITDSAIVFTGTSIVGVLTLGYYFILVRVLSSEDYGTFNALISLVMFSTMAFSPLGTTLTRFFTEYITRKDFVTLSAVYVKLFKRLAFIALLIMLFFISFAPLGGRFLKTDPFYIVICGLIVSLCLFAPLVSSIFQSLQRFKMYSFVLAMSSLGKVVLGLWLMLVGWKLVGGLFGFVVDPIITIAIGFVLIPKLFDGAIVRQYAERKSIKISLKPIMVFFIPVSVLMISFSVLTNIDVVLVKHFFPAVQAGYYSIAQMVGKVFLFLPSALAIVLLPKSTKAHVESGSSQAIFQKSLWVGAVCCAVGVILCFLFPQWILNILTSKANPVSNQLVGPFSLAMSFYALLWIELNFCLGIHYLKIVFPVAIFALLEAVAIYFCHSSFINILYIFIIVAAMSFFTALVMIKTHLKTLRKIL